MFTKQKDHMWILNIHMQRISAEHILYTVKRGLWKTCTYCVMKIMIPLYHYHDEPTMPKFSLDESNLHVHHVCVKGNWIISIIHRSDTYFSDWYLHRIIVDPMVFAMKPWANFPNFTILGELSKLVFMITYFRGWNYHPDFMAHFVLEIRWQLCIGDA